MAERSAKVATAPRGDECVCSARAGGRRCRFHRCLGRCAQVYEIGSVTESIEAVRMAKEAGWGVMTSHRSGETEDSFIADLAVGLATGQIKTGAPCRCGRRAARPWVFA